MLILKKFLRDVPAVLGFCIILAICLIAILSPLIVPDLDRVYDGDLTRRLQREMGRYISGCRTLALEGWRQRRFHHAWTEHMARMLSPLL